MTAFALRTLVIAAAVGLSSIVFAQDAATTPPAMPATPAAAPAPLAANAMVKPDALRQLFARTAPALVVVQYTWASEVRKLEVAGAGVVVRADGLVMTSLALVNPQIPDEQLTEFKIIIPHVDRDDEEIDAAFLGRDERSNLAFLKPKAAGRTWPFVTFIPADVAIGDPVLSVGILPKSTGYRPYITQANVSGMLRGPIPQVLTSGGLAGVYSPVFDSSGQAIGLVAPSPGQPIMLNDPRADRVAVSVPPTLYIPASDFLSSIADPPAGGEPMKMPFLGVQQMNGLNKQSADYFGLANTPAVEIGDVISNTPADQGGLKRGDIVVSFNGRPLERGDLPEELPMILSRQISRLKVGDTVALGVIRGKGTPTHTISIKLGERPPGANLAERFYADDLGFTVRALTFEDRYDLRLKDPDTGVIIAMVRPQSPAANAQLQGNELVTQLNGKPVTSVDEFRADYQSARHDRPAEAVVLVVNRGGREDTLRIEPPQ